MEQAQNGDQKAYAQLLQGIYPVIQRFLIKRLGALGHDDDLTQECIMAIHKARHTYDSSRKFLPWMFAVVNYKAIDIMRKKQRIWSREITSDEIIATISTDETNTELEEETSELVHAALNSLPDDMRRAVELTKIQGLDTKEAAEREGISSAALRTRISRAYKVMRKQLEKNNVY